MLNYRIFDLDRQTTEHSAQRRKEGAAINTSLLALKECVRSLGKGAGTDRLAAPTDKEKRVPAFRSSPLTLPKSIYYL